MLKIYTVYDSKAGFYDKPFVQRSTGEALRSWQTAANSPDTAMGTHPSDYTLFEIGEFDTDNGGIKVYEAKKSLGLALDYVKPSDKMVKSSPVSK